MGWSGEHLGEKKEGDGSITLVLGHWDKAAGRSGQHGIESTDSHKPPFALQCPIPQ